MKGPFTAPQTCNTKADKTAPVSSFTAPTSSLQAASLSPLQTPPSSSPRNISHTKSLMPTPPLKIYLFMKFPHHQPVHHLLYLSHTSLSNRHFTYPAKLSAFCDSFSISSSPKINQPHTNLSPSRTAPTPFLFSPYWCLLSTLPPKKQRLPPQQPLEMNERKTQNPLPPVKQHWRPLPCPSMIYLMGGKSFFPCCYCTTEKSW